MEIHFSHGTGLIFEFGATYRFREPYLQDTAVFNLNRSDRLIDLQYFNFEKRGSKCKGCRKHRQSTLSCNLFRSQYCFYSCIDFKSQKSRILVESKFKSQFESKIIYGGIFEPIGTIADIGSKPKA